MANIKCKMCGGELNITEGVSVATCEYCGTTQTLPKLDDERRANLYDRASHFRRNNEFDKAAGLYNQILNEDPTDAEAYWSLVLCKYGIEYVEDPTTRKRIPTVNRAQFTSVVADEDYKKAVEHADALSRSLYEQEAHAIDEIQKGILAISSQEEPFDVFICYKETDRNGRRTPDSVLANDLYHQLTQEGFKVFFARITLEDKLGTAYEPYIFAALNSAKVMVALGTKPEYFNAVWVKNEWSRYLSLIRGGAKKVLIPAYRDMDPYDLPEEFSHLQAQDMSKLGFMQDLIRGIKKIAGAEQPKTIVKETVTVAAGADTAPLLRRVALFLEDGNWTEADTYCERVLDMDPENAQAYVGKLMAELRVKQQADLANQQNPFDDRSNYKKALRFADDKLAAELKGYITYINQRNEEERLDSTYKSAFWGMDSAVTEADFLDAAKTFDSIVHYKDASEKAAECREKAEIQRKDDIYSSACRHMGHDTVGDLEKAIRQFEEIPNWKDVSKKIAECQQRIHELEEAKKLDYYQKACKLMDTYDVYDLRTACDYFKYTLRGWRDSAEKLEECHKRINELEQRERIEAEKAEAARLAAKKKKKRKTILALIAVALIAAAALAYVYVLQPMEQYNAAEELLALGDYDGAKEAFEKLGTFMDAPERVIDAQNAKLESFYLEAEALYAEGRYDSAIVAFKKAGDYSNAADRILEVQYAKADGIYADGNYGESVSEFEKLGDYKDAVARSNEAKVLSLNSPEVGGIVYFGSYEQDNNTANGKEDIAWLVLDKEDDCILVISQYVLDAQRYNDKETSISWANCTLRTWLNGTFLKTAFSAEEQKAIPTVTNVNPNNPNFDTPGGENTKDRVFLLSIQEAEEYFDSRFKRAAKRYTRAQPGTSVAEGYCSWWLRSPGIDCDEAAEVGSDGDISTVGITVISPYYSVRPAMWIDLSEVAK